MLDKLPLELLDHVLELLPPPSTIKGARERTKTLLSCCLVSKRVYERALPVLWRDIRLESEEQVRMMVTVVEQGVAAELRSSTKAFIVAGDPYSGFPISLKGPLRLVELFPAVQTLALTSGSDGTVDLRLLATGLPSESFFSPQSPPQTELLSVADLGLSTSRTPLLRLFLPARPSPNSVLSDYDTSSWIVNPSGVSSDFQSSRD
jgi:hypothetical protein